MNSFFFFFVFYFGSAVYAVEIRRSGKHSFPLLTHTGEQSINEFQFIVPENIVDERSNSDITYQISEISPLVISNDEIVTLNFKSSLPASKDWIGAYSPSDVDIKKTVPVKYGWCDDSQDYLSTGFGSLTFNFTNLRSDIKFYYFTNGTTYPILKSSSDLLVRFKNNNQPLRPRIVPTGDYDIFNLLWSSSTSKKPILMWGSESKKYQFTVSAKTSQITIDDVCGAPANTVGWRDLGLIHTAELVGMKTLANQKIYYSFGDLDTGDFSEEHVFFVPPLPGTQPPKRPTRAIMFDDLGRGSTDQSYTWNEYGRPSVTTFMAIGAEVNRGDIDVIYHGGDISYATGYIAVWDFFLDMISPVAGSVIYLTTVGNHESDWYNSSTSFSNSDSGGECGILTTKLIPMPEPATTDKPWWSYDVGLIHFVGISTEHDYTIGSEQYKWLENDLKSVNRKITPWIIFGGHRAMYLNSNYGGSVNSDLVVMDSMIENLEPLLFKYRVNIGFYGHNHVVQRQAAVYNKTVVQSAKPVLDSNGKTVYLHEDPQATVHMVIGTGGAAFTINSVSPPPVWNELVFYEWGYARVTAYNESYLDWEWVLNTSGEVLDHMVIIQGDPSKPWKL